MKNPLQQELETFERLKDQLLQDEGKFAVISGNELLGVYSSYDDALQIGYERYNLTPFLVKKISAVEQAKFFARKTAFRGYYELPMFSQHQSAQLPKIESNSTALATGSYW